MSLELETRVGEVERRLRSLESVQQSSQTTNSLLASRLGQISACILSADQHRSKLKASHPDELEVLQIQIDMLFEALAPTQEGQAPLPSVLDYDEATPLNIGLTKLNVQPPEGTDYLVTLSLPADMTLNQYLDQCKEQYHKARGHKAPTSVKVQDCRDSSERMAGLFDQWLVFAYTLGQLNPQAVGYMRDTVAGLKEVMDDAVDELTKRA